MDLSQDFHFGFRVADSTPTASSWNSLAAIKELSAASGLFRIAHFGRKSIRNSNLQLVAADTSDTAPSRVLALTSVGQVVGFSSQHRQTRHGLLWLLSVPEKPSFLTSEPSLLRARL
jgi:hypothetical protein